MNVLTRNFKEFVENIALEPDKIQLACNAASDVSEFLTSQIPNSSTEIIGSFAKNTQIRPEIDIVLKTPSQIQAQSVKNLLSQKYSNCNDLKVIFPDCEVNVFLQSNGNVYAPKQFENTTQKDIEQINAIEVYPRNNAHELIMIIKYWRNFNDVEMSSHFIESEALEFLRISSHAQVSYLLYGFMMMKFFAHLIRNPKSEWIGEAEKAYELTRRGILLDDKKEALKCFRQLFGDAFPATVYELHLDEYVM